MFNSIVLEGRLTKDLEYLPLNNNNDPNKIGCRFSIAHDFKKGVVLFFDCVYFGTKGITPWLKKGSAVILRGKLEYSDYQDRQGQMKRSYRIITEDISFTMSNCGNGNNQQQNGGVFGGQNGNNNYQQKQASQYQQAPSYNTQYQQAPAPNNTQYQQGSAPNYQQVPNNTQYQQAPTPNQPGSDNDEIIPF